MDECTREYRHSGYRSGRSNKTRVTTIQQETHTNQSSYYQEPAPRRRLVISTRVVSARYYRRLLNLQQPLISFPLTKQVVANRL